MSTWVESKQELKRTYTFKTFADAMKWMLDVSVIIDAVNHHPTWTNEYNKVKVSLSTHECGYIVTNKDRQLASQMDQVYLHYSK